MAVKCTVQKSHPSSNLGVKGQGYEGQKNEKCGILFGSRPLGRGPRAAFFSGVILGARLRRWENQRMLSNFGRNACYRESKQSKMLYLRSHPTSASALPGKEETQKLCVAKYQFIPGYGLQCLLFLSFYCSASQH